ARVNLVRSTTGKDVLTGHESGGGNQSLGHYVGFVSLAGFPFISNRKLISLGVNAIHRQIVVTSLIRFAVFRYREDFLHAFITMHRAPADKTDRAQMLRQTLFRGKFGEINKDGIITFPSEDGGED